MTMAAEIPKTQAPEQKSISFMWPHPIFHGTIYFQIRQTIFSKYPNG
jgi:hypothetical protein